MKLTWNFRKSPALFAVALALSRLNSISAEEPILPHLSRIQPGGMPGLPVITGINRSTNGVTLTWDGPAGAYQLYQKSKVTDTAWKRVGDTSLLRAATVTTSSDAALFEISGPAPHYAGVRACLECHSPVAETVTHTRHFGAFTNALFIAQGGQTDASCLPCHTVGFSANTGFISADRTPHLANVQCESCHGPAALHAANPEDPVLRPRAEISAAVCGGCHNTQFVPARVAAAHPPYYEDWSQSGHHEVLEELKEDFLTSPSLIGNCGACHSGTAREALLENTALPSPHEAGAVGIACATCHDSHQEYAHVNVLHGPQTNLLTGFVVNNRSLGMLYTNQIRGPLASLQDFHSTGSFATNYNPDINICAQCHNDRGASAKTTSRPPHHSAQYNMLIGSFRQQDTTVPAQQAGTHALLEKQCVACHMQTPDGSSGHTFKVEAYGLCSDCHEQPALLVQFTTNSVMAQIERTKAALNLWAQTKAPTGLQKYGAKAWEYTASGTLSEAGPSPSASEQALIPNAIQTARFNLYLVNNEGSFGVHNGPYTIRLLNAAYSLVMDELNK